MSTAAITGNFPDDDWVEWIVARPLDASAQDNPGDDYCYHVVLSFDSATEPTGQQNCSGGDPGASPVSITVTKDPSKIAVLPASTGIVIADEVVEAEKRGQARMHFLPQDQITPDLSHVKPPGRT